MVGGSAFVFSLFYILLLLNKLKTLALSSGDILHL